MERRFKRKKIAIVVFGRCQPSCSKLQNFQLHSFHKQLSINALMEELIHPVVILKQEIEYGWKPSLNDIFGVVGISEIRCEEA